MEDSADSSGVAPRNYLKQEGTSTVVETESRAPKWTDQKHCSFLNSLESTFVNQLYKSMGLFGWHSGKSCPHRSKSSKHNLTSIRSSGQFKVLHGGHLSKIDFTKDEAEVDQEEESKVLWGNPWIQHYRNLKIKFPASLARTSSTTNEDQNRTHNFQLVSQDPTGSNTEVTDQNFNDEALEEEKLGTMHDTKRTRTSTSTFSSNDQIVPSCNSVQTGDVAEDHVHVAPKKLGSCVSHKD